MRTKSSILLSLSFLTLAHALSFAAFYYDFRDVRSGLLPLLIPSKLLVYVFGIFLPFAVDFVVGFLARSARQIFLYALASVVLFHLDALLLDWISGRLADSRWFQENPSEYPRELFWRFALPLAFVLFGALLGVLKRRFSLGLRARHA
jgi:hypothetical protein